MNDLDIRLDGRSWTAPDMGRHHELPGCLELIDGKLCFEESQRMLLLTALLEQVGMRRAVLLGPLDAWQTAIRERQENEEGGEGDEMPAVGVG